jgi:hypothetical protein
MPTLEQIQATMKKLQLQADALIAKKAQSAVDQIRRLMLAHGLTTEDIEAKAKAKREGKAASGAAVSAKSSKVSGMHCASNAHMRSTCRDGSLSIPTVRT